ncbi:cyclase family protein [Schumannella sp. 10F1B-5-1]|uniref:cyclase family protein n=1 Tax=Schumannella sp. 10F1B-5-1 TaxID=2590780 RepID=UPI00112FE0FE|nr:cyclase family protein [Schumannella sp. 10F1B-5-1]TPW78246.1 cyclase family protein [Schumannella sp. 10F1B-5-1]
MTDASTVIGAGTGLPDYDSLLTRTDGPAGTSWGLWGADDELGTVNLLTPERIVAAAALVRTGKRFSLDHAVNAFEPFPSGTRHAAEHHMFANNPWHRDEYVDSYYPQSSSQIDALRHVGDPAFGFYGGRTREQITDQTTTLGVQNYADAGLVGRGVLLDVDRHLAAAGRPLGVNDPTAFDAELLDEVAAAQGVEVKAGDLLLVRTGWAGRYLALTDPERRELNKGRSTPGLAQKESVVRWLWDHGVALVAADNTGVERYPAQDSDFYDPSLPPPERGPNHNGMIHRPLLARLGMAFGELWALDELAADCAADGVYEFLLVASPLPFAGAAGSPANATAIK